MCGSDHIRGHLREIDPWGTGRISVSMSSAGLGSGGTDTLARYRGRAQQSGDRVPSEQVSGDPVEARTRQFLARLIEAGRL